MSALNQNAITRLATVSAVDMNALAATALFVVPLDKNCIIDHIIVRQASLSMTTATYSFGFNAGVNNDVIADDYYAELVDDTVYVKIQPKLGAKVGGAGETLSVIINVVQGAAATTTMEVFGYLF